MTATTRNFLRIIVGAGVVLALLYLALSPGEKADLSPLPIPNGYDDFLKATNSLGPFFDPGQMYTAQALHTLVESNATALAEARLGLERECRVPLADTPDYPRIAERRLAALQTLGLAFIAEGRDAENEGRLSDALGSYLAAIRFGHEMRRGGLILDSMEGFACEGQGHSGIVGLLPRLNREQLRLAIEALESIEAKREPWKAVVDRDKRYTKANYSSWRYVTGRLSLAMSGQFAVVERIARSAQAHLHLLMIELALRTYRADRGAYPDRLDVLVPDFLKTLPQDPFRNQSFIYRTTPEGFVLYSVGPDERDDGGKPLGFQPRRRGLEQGDISISSPW